MKIGYSDGKTKIKYILLLISILFISSFSIFELRKVISGPILNMNVFSTVTDNKVKIIDGFAENVKDLYIANKKVLMDKSGYFNQTILLYPGHNDIKIIAIDRFDKKTIKKINIYYEIN